MLLSSKKHSDPIIIEEVFTSNHSASDTFSQQLLNDINYCKVKNQKSCHLIVFVHGFQATSVDLAKFRNFVWKLLPLVSCLISKSNEADTHASIEQLGLNLATEVKLHLHRYFENRTDKLKKISFIGHSLGGIITREALKHLGKYADVMHGFVSLGSPHLGYMYNSSGLVDAGMWMLQKWKNSKSLQQLSMTDSKDYRDSFLYRLS